jgi:hypothetical protein
LDLFGVLTVSALGAFCHATAFGHLEHAHDFPIPLHQAYLLQAAASLSEVVDPKRDSGCRINETAFLEYALAFVKSIVGLFPGAARPHKG